MIRRMSEVRFNSWHLIVAAVTALMADDLIGRWL